MFTGVSQTICMAIALLAFYGLDFLLIAYYAKQRQGRSWDLGYTLIGLGIGATLCLQPIFLPQVALRITASWGLWLQVTGIVLILTSLGLQLWARMHLGRFYAEGADVQPGHYVIETGPYAYVRHPLFTSYIMFTIGLVGVTPALTTLAVMLYSWWDFTRAAKADEKLLSEAVPGYVDYMSRVPRFIPRFGKSYLNTG